VDLIWIDGENELWIDLQLFRETVEDDEQFFDVLHPLHSRKQQECRENYTFELAQRQQQQQQQEQQQLPRMRNVTF